MECSVTFLIEVVAAHEQLLCRKLDPFFLSQFCCVVPCNGVQLQRNLLSPSFLGHKKISPKGQYIQKKCFVCFLYQCQIAFLEQQRKGIHSPPKKKALNNLDQKNECSSKQNWQKIEISHHQVNIKYQTSLCLIPLFISPKSWVSDFLNLNEEVKLNHFCYAFRF